MSTFFESRLIFITKEKITFKPKKEYQYIELADINSSAGVVDNTEKVLDDALRKDVKAYLFSSKERPMYEYKYAIHKSLIYGWMLMKEMVLWKWFVFMGVRGKRGTARRSQTGSVKQPKNKAPGFSVMC